MLRLHPLVLRTSAPASWLAPRRTASSRTRSPAGPVRAVIFDMGGVIVPSPLPKIRATEAQESLPPGTIGQIIERGSKAWSDLECGRLTLDQFFPTFSAEVAAVVGRSVDLSDMLTGSPEPFPEMEDCLRCLRTDGFKTALLTNNWILPGGGSILPADVSLFDVVVESCREGVCKPDPEIFQRCLERLGVQPEEAVFLDDLGRNLKAAAGLGMGTVLVQEPNQAISDLEELLGQNCRGFAEGTTQVPSL